MISLNLLNSGSAGRGVLLVLWGMLAGCAQVHGAPRAPPADAALLPSNPMARRARPRILLASSDEATTGETSTGQGGQGYNVPGRNPNSGMPWEFFLGNAAHRLIAYMYKVNHPGRLAYFNTKTLSEILANNGIGDPARLLPHERNRRPDITDISALLLFEIKPWGERGLIEGRQEAEAYLAALNRAVVGGESFTGGTNFQGEMLIRFAQGQYIWRLEWQTPEPGVTQYRWTRSQQRFESAAEAADAGHWVTLTPEEMRQYGGWVERAVEGMVARREQLETFRGAIGFAIDIIGEGTQAIFMGAIFSRMGSPPGAQQPPTRGGGQVIPFPVRPVPATPPTRLPAAGGM